MDNPPTADFHDERIDMGYWFPKLEGLNVPTPETIELSLEISDGSPEWDQHKAETIVRDLGGEAFIRSGYKSAGHGLEEGSHIRSADTEDVKSTIEELLSQHVMMSMPTGGSLWLREWLDLDWCRYARDNLVPEVRVFIRDGEVTCYHPRLEGFRNHERHREAAEDIIESAWEPQERPEWDDYQRPTPLKVYAERVANEFDGWWSVDFVMDTNGDWWCTDMALDALYDRSERGKEGMGGISEHPGDCKHDIENHG